MLINVLKLGQVTLEGPYKIINFNFFFRRCIITCGRDGDVRVWAGFEDDDPISHSVGESAFSLQQKDQKLYVANESSVQILTFPEGERDGILTKYPSPVTHMLLSPDSNVIFFCTYFYQNLKSLHI